MDFDITPDYSLTSWAKRVKYNKRFPEFEFFSCTRYTYIATIIAHVEFVFDILDTFWLSIRHPQLKLICTDYFTINMMHRNHPSHATKHFLTNAHHSKAICSRELFTPKPHTSSPTLSPSCSRRSTHTINNPHRCQTSPDIIDTVDGSLGFIKMYGTFGWWFDHTFIPNDRKWVIQCHITVLDIETWCILTLTMHKTLCHPSEISTKTIGGEI